MASVYAIKTPVFEGPLELLLELIEKRKLLINEITLAKVTDDYIAHIRQLTEFPLKNTAVFILIASTLLLIKSKSLLPSLELTEEETEEIGDLEKRLALYQQYRQVGAGIGRIFGKRILFSRQDAPVLPVFSPDESMTLPNIVAALNQALANAPKPAQIPRAIIKKVVSLDEMIDRLAMRIQQSLRMSFREFSAADKAERVEVVVSFLAMLELVKQGMIQVTQHGAFDDIHMETEAVGVPSYS